MKSNRLMNLPIEMAETLESSELIVLSGGLDGILVPQANNDLGVCSGTNNGSGKCSGTNNGSGRCSGTNNHTGTCEGGINNGNGNCFQINPNA